MKKYNYYAKNLDKAWFDSSNIAYSECVDDDNELKTVRITFKNGTTYEYKDVNVNDYLMFRENSSQGKAFNKFIKKYPYTKLDGLKNIEDIENSLNEHLLLDNNFSIKLSDNKVIYYVNGNETGQIEDLEKNELSGIEKLANALHIKIITD